MILSRTRQLSTVGALIATFAFSSITSAGPAEPAAKPAAQPVAPGEIRSHAAEALGVSLEIKSFTLANGLAVYVVEDNSSPMFALHIAYDVGSRDEVEGRTGFAHLFEHMMFKGSANVPDGGHFEYVLGAGGQMNAFTTPDVTQYFNILPSHYLDRILWLEADRMRSLDITDQTFENQRQAVKEEKAMRVDNVPYAKALVEFFAEAWKGTGYGHTTIGSDQDLDAATTADVQAFFDTYYVPNNAVMVIVGDVSIEELKPKVEKYFAEIPRGAEREPFEPISHEQAKLEQRIEDPMAQQPLYMIGWKTVPETHADRHAVELLMNILLRGDSSRITKILKDEKKLVVASLPLPSMLSGGRDAGSALAAFIPVQGAGLDDIKKVIVDEIQEVVKKGIAKKELEKATNQLTVDTISSLATNNGRAMLIAQGVIAHRDPTYVLSDLQKYQAVTVRDIKRVAAKYLTDKWLVLEIVPPSK
jgi:zinc protease